MRTINDRFDAAVRSSMPARTLILERVVDDRVKAGLPVARRSPTMLAVRLRRLPVTRFSIVGAAVRFPSPLLVVRRFSASSSVWREKDVSWMAVS